jgi:hypothetical protein
MAVAEIFPRAKVAEGIQGRPEDNRGIIWFKGIGKRLAR